MNRSLLVLLGLAISLDVGFANELSGSRPNIVLVMTDDQGYGPVGRHGHPWIRTPHLDDLYDNSVRLDRFLVSPTCAPTRSSMMTGRYSMQNGVTHTINERERMTLDAVTLPQVLGSVGYRCGIFGKWHLGDEDLYQPQNRGFHEAFIHGGGGIGQAYDNSCADAPNNKYFDPVIRHNGRFVKTEGFCTDVFFTAAIGWIKQRHESGEPFFAYIATNAPHGPFLAPPKYKRRFLDAGFTEEEAGFYGMIENIDDNMGRLMTGIDSTGLAENTLLIFMSDNGMTGGGSGRLGKILGKAPDGTDMEFFNADMKGLKGSVDEGGVRVPFFASWRGRLRSGRTVEHVAAHIDLLPTLAELAGAQPPSDQVVGRSFLPLLESDDAKWPDRFIFAHKGRWPVGAEPNDFQWRDFAVRSHRFRFVENKFLYDMKADPGQTENCIDQHPDVVSEMREAYDQWWKKTRPMMINENVPMSPERPFHVAYFAQQESTGIPHWQPLSLPEGVSASP